MAENMRHLKEAVKLIRPSGHVTGPLTEEMLMQPPSFVDPNRRVVLVVLSDTHAGHKLGLMSPDVILFDEDERGNLKPYTPQLTASQKYLWQLYQENIARTKEIAGDSEIVVIHNGDLTQGLRHPEQIISTRMSDHVLIAVSNLEMWAALPNLRAMRIVAGTGSHEFSEGSASHLVHSYLKHKAPDRNIGMLYHGLLNVGGVLVDYAHHGPHPGTRTWLKGNVARLYMKDIMLREVMSGNKPPELVFRAHFHTYVRELVSTHGYESNLIITPAYCMMGDYAVQRTGSQYVIDNGHVVVEIEGGEVQKIHKLVKTVDFRTKETI